ncbi:hypothetical protein [Leptolyngbya sp. 7M]|uniref:hypothetical protein n=1 Tax=Leptolyngbya sp. 7M TaxID=2812896 RepID=UPI001B8C7DE9|nr:hypothetical protein [Leptolyngbya sp. 7M]QYO67375.1 hypothetical protein JVX88_11590 [Leptolyngbya sp. 7M]
MTIELENIQLLAKQCGIDAIGAAPVERLDNEAERLFDWIDKRFHGEMSWIAREPEKRRAESIMLRAERLRMLRIRFLVISII